VVARLEIGDALAYLANNTSEVTTGDVGKLDRNDVLDCTRAYHPIGRVNTGGTDAHEYLASGGFGIFDVFVFEV
jgi:hypothetical protein